MDSDLVRTHHPFPLQNLLSQPWGHGDAKFAMYITLHCITLHYVTLHCIPYIYAKYNYVFVYTYTVSFL